MELEILELSGYVQKLDTLRSMDQYVMKGTFVLETVNPFFGYHTSTPAELIPQTIYLITSVEYQTEDIARASTKIRKYLDLDFDAAKAEVIIHNSKYTAIRLYDIKDFDDVEVIQRAFADEGIQFRLSRKKIEGEFLCKIWKVFLLREVELGLYANMSKSKMFYFTLPKFVSYSHFKELVKKVKNNWAGKSFDATPGMLYRKIGVEEVVRVFSNQITDEMMEELPKLFKRFID